tara:strand:+ start:12914 stop:14206 length:1293 start_codon:yes stop_codon:yes gene_type:complete
MSKNATSNKLGLKELIAMGVGGMIGGGIFSVLGLAVDISGHAAPVAFLLGSVIAFFAGYSYIKLAVTFKSDGASFTYLEHAFPKFPSVAGLVGWSVIIGYVGTLALYAYTFGAYGAEMLGYSGSTYIRATLSVLVLLGLMVINLRGVSSSGITEDLIVYAKIFILAFFGFIGLHSIESVVVTPVFNQGISSVFVAGALIFVAFEGFQLITNEVVETQSPDKNIPRGIYSSIAITSILYIVIAIITVATLTAVEIRQAEEYALAVVAEPILGKGGRILIGIAALLSTSSAINSTLFGAARMMAVMAERNNMPPILAKRSLDNTPWVAIMTLTILALLFSTINTLETIASFSSLIFLIVCAAVSIANLKLHNLTQCNKTIVMTAIMLISSTIILLLFHLAKNDIKTLLWVISLLFFVTILEVVISRVLKQHD